MNYGVDDWDEPPQSLQQKFILFSSPICRFSTNPQSICSKSSPLSIQSIRSLVTTQSIQSRVSELIGLIVDMSVDDVYDDSVFVGQVTNVHFAVGRHVVSEILWVH
jgi:hypothetical protein